MTTQKEKEAPFTIELIDKEPVTVINKRTGKSALLTPIQVAVYDKTIGAMILGVSNNHKIGAKWFEANYPEIYEILLKDKI